TGRTPFDGESSQEIIMKHLTADPDLSAVPQPYRSIIQRALQKDSAKRFHNAEEMLETLDPPTTPSAGTKPGPGPAEPLYIGDESEGIELGPLQQRPERAIPADIVLPTGINEEPIAKAVRESVGNFAHWWNHGPLTTGGKIALIVAALVVAIFHGGWLIPT